jgi:hypothetical protein
MCHGLGRDIRRVSGIGGEDISERHLPDEVFMHGDETRRHCTAFSIDDRDAVRREGLGDLGDLVVLNQYI